MIESLRRGFVEDEDAKRKRGPIGMTAYEELRYQRLQSKRGSSSGGGSAHSIVEQEVGEIAHHRGKGSVRLANKDFRLVDQEEIPHGSIDLVLALSFPDPKTPKDEGGKIHERLMGCACPG
jgi:hypothetical protein